MCLRFHILAALFICLFSLLCQAGQGQNVPVGPIDTSKHHHTAAAAPVDTAATTTTTPPRAIRFVLTMGLEGTGHHLARAIALQSPTRNATQHLAHDIKLAAKAFSSIWRAVSFPNPESYQFIDSRYHALVEQLKLIQTKAAASLDHGTTHNIFFAVDDSTYVWSYPFYVGTFRHLLYPDVDLFYRACDAAGMSCGHVYLHRDPFEVIESTTVKRPFNPNPLVASKLYLSMLNVMYSQMTAYPDRTLACWGFYETHDSQTTNDNMWTQVGDLFGWTDPAAFVRHVLPKISQSMANATINCTIDKAEYNFLEPV